LGLEISSQLLDLGLQLVDSLFRFCLVGLDLYRLGLRLLRIFVQCLLALFVLLLLGLEISSQLLDLVFQLVDDLLGLGLL